MSSDDWYYTDDDRFDDDGDSALASYETKLIDAGIREQSEGSVRWALGTYGDAVTARITRLLEEARTMRGLDLHGGAIVAATSAVEILVRFLVVRPLVQGAFLSDLWAEILTTRIVGAVSREDRVLLPSVVGTWGLDLGGVRLADGRAAWDQFTGPIRAKRNRVVHEGEPATQTEADLAIETVERLMGGFVPTIAARFGLQWPERTWSVDIIESDGSIGWRHYAPQDPFERASGASAEMPD